MATPGDDSKRIVVNPGLLDVLWQPPGAEEPKEPRAPAGAGPAPHSPSVPIAEEGARHATRLAESPARGRPAEIPPSQWHQAGESNFRIQSYRTAANCFRRAVNAEPRRWQPRFNLAICLARMEQWEEAASGFEQAAALEPNLWAARTALGICLLRCRRPRAAYAAFTQALRLAPGEAQSRLGCALALHGMERFQEALTAYESVLAEVGEREDLLVNLAAAAAAAGRADRAAHYTARLRQIASTHPRGAGVHQPQATAR